MHNCWISCQVMADGKKVYDDLIIINLYQFIFQSVLEGYNATIMAYGQTG